jgi:hypothetical protein
VITQAIRSRDLALLIKAKHLLADYRRLGLAQSGELGLANVVFKTLRNSGVIATLHQAILHLEDIKLTVK